MRICCLVALVVAALNLTGCIIIPAGPPAPSYAYAPAYGYAYYPPPVSFDFGFGGGRRWR